MAQQLEQLHDHEPCDDGIGGGDGGDDVARFAFDLKHRQSLDPVTVRPVAVALTVRLKTFPTQNAAIFPARDHQQRPTANQDSTNHHRGCTGDLQPQSRT